MSEIFNNAVRILDQLYSMRRSHKLICIAVLDAILVVSCLITATYLRLDSFEATLLLHDGKTFLLLPLVSIIIFKVGGIYNIVIRYDDHSSHKTLAMCIATSCLALSATDHFLNTNIPRSVVIIYGIMLLIVIPASRASIRSIFSFVGTNSTFNVLIIGADKEIVPFINALKSSITYRIIGIISNDRDAVGSRILGTKVFHATEVTELVSEYNNCLALVLDTPTHNQDSSALINTCIEHSIPVKYCPTLKNLINGAPAENNFIPLPINKLLNRDAVNLTAGTALTSLFRDKTVLVTGAGGSIGSELCKQIIFLGVAKLILFDISELALYNIDQHLIRQKQQLPKDIEIITILGSVEDRVLLEDLFNTYPIFCVFHAAAYKHVPLVEKNAISGIKNNFIGTKTILDIAKNKNVERFVFISSDKAVRPTNIMGASKRLGELLCQTASTTDKNFKCSIVRFGNVLGSSGSVVPLFESQISSGGPITITDERITRYFMTVEEAVRLVLMASTISQGNEIFVLDMGEPVKIIELAKQMVKLRGLEPVVSGKESAKLDTVSDLSAKKTIDIKFVGLRPGEKLYEELFWGDDTRTTNVPKLFESHEEFITADFAQDVHKKIADALEKQDIGDILKIIEDPRIGFRKPSNG